jgi:hypothetical protein
MRRRSRIADETGDGFFKESDDVAEEIRVLRGRFTDQCEIRTYGNLKDLQPQLQEVMTGWLAAVKLAAVKA